MTVPSKSNEPTMPNADEVDDDALNLSSLDGTGSRLAKPEVNGPQFQHHSLEASRLLGLPHSSSLHLAVTTLVERLLALHHQSLQSAEVVRITAFRVASRTVLERLPFECAAAKFLTLIDAGEPDYQASELAYRTKRTDWVGEAMAAIAAEGHDPGPDARPWATRYGWDSLRP